MACRGYRIREVCTKVSEMFFIPWYTLSVTEIFFPVWVDDVIASHFFCKTPEAVGGYLCPIAFQL